MASKRLEADIQASITKDRAAKEHQYQEKLRKERETQASSRKYFLAKIDKYFSKLADSTDLKIDPKENQAVFTYKDVKYYVMRVEKWDDTNIPDEGYTPHWYWCWVLRKDSPYPNNQYTGFVNGRSNEYMLSYTDWSLDELDCYAEVIKGIRVLNGED